MGSFFGSIHVQRDDDARVNAALRSVATSLGVSFYVRPPQGRWVAVLPSHRGQDLSVSDAIAARLSSSLVHVLVHDSDVFAYAVHRGGAVVDMFASNLNYFAPESAVERDRLFGRPSRYADLIDPSSSVDAVEALLERARYFASARGAWLGPGEQLDGIMAAADVETDDFVRRARPLKARIDEELVTRAQEQLGIDAADVSELIVRLTRLKTGTARDLLREHRRRLHQLFSAATPHGGVLNRLGVAASADDAFMDFADALGLSEAELSYEDVRAAGQDMGALVHISPEPG